MVSRRNQGQGNGAISVLSAKFPRQAKYGPAGNRARSCRYAGIPRGTGPGGIGHWTLPGWLGTAGQAPIGSRLAGKLFACCAQMNKYVFPGEPLDLCRPGVLPQCLNQCFVICNRDLSHLGTEKAQQHALFT